MWNLETLVRLPIVRRLQDALALPRHALLVALVSLLMMGAATGVLAKWYHEARTRQAEYQLGLGKRRAAEGALDAALDHYRAALALERDNRLYRRTVALALLQLHQYSEAERHLDELLEQDPVDAEANLLRARLAARRGLVENTEAYYQRAIYGRWPGDERGQRIAARFDLLAWLEQIGAMDRARAELLRLQVEVPDTPSLQQQLARHFVTVGEPFQAVQILRGQMSRHPEDAALARQLMATALGAGRLEDARLAARRVVALNPSDDTSRRRLGELNEALSLDPTRRRLSTAERVRRSGQLLARTIALVENCPAVSPMVSSPETVERLMSARQLLDQQTTLATRNTLIDERISVAESLWNIYGPRCRGVDQPLEWVFEQLLQN
jgi:tetratricopeptide (TPR) repeat protein